GSFDLVPPSEWLVVIDKRNHYVKNFELLIAAWGDHVHTSDSVRCHYYDPSKNHHIELETRDRFDKTKVASHPGWEPNSDEGLYYMCTSYDSHNVNECT